MTISFLGETLVFGLTARYVSIIWPCFPTTSNSRAKTFGAATLCGLAWVPSAGPAYFKIRGCPILTSRFFCGVRVGELASVAEKIVQIPDRDRVYRRKPPPKQSLDRAPSKSIEMR